MLISTVPPAYLSDVLQYIVSHPAVDALRYNTGTSSPDSPYETLSQILQLANSVKKPLYVDLKGKQLRVVEWANLPEGIILLNHNIEVDLPARVYFRGDDSSTLRRVVRGNEIYVDPLPKAPVGRGQSINIIGENVRIEGGLLPLDHEYIKAALDLGIRQFLLSFVESKSDIEELEEAIDRHSGGKVATAECEIVFKIESRAGVEFVRALGRKNFTGKSPYRLMAARDDLMIHIGALAMPEALALIADRDPDAICASRLLMGLEQGSVSMGDVSDIEYMRMLGYKNFMFSDGISREHSKEACGFWQDYVAARPFTE